MFLIDSHCHLDYEPMISDISSTLNQAQHQEIKAFLTICTELSKASLLKTLTDTHENVFATIGVHPHEAANTLPQAELFAFLTKEANHPKVVGFGETGLDYYYNHSPLDSQKAAFKAHIETALICDLPLIVHTRNADQDTIEMLKEIGQNKARGVMHCFSGDENLRDQALELGFYISVSGIVTFKKAQELRNVLKDVPLDRLLLETDSPYLAPEPYRGKSNQPAFMIETAKTLAALKEISLEDLAAHTTRNFLTLFSKARIPCA